jgi:hypothetical protein
LVQHYKGNDKEKRKVMSFWSSDGVGALVLFIALFEVVRAWSKRVGRTIWDPVLDVVLVLSELS